VEDDADEEKEHEEDRVVPKEFGADGGQSKVERRDLEKALEINHEVPCRHKGPGGSLLTSIKHASMNRHVQDVNCR
jgi:hypothetical protein